MFSSSYAADNEHVGPLDASPLAGGAHVAQDFEAAVAAMMAHPGQAPSAHPQWPFAHAYTQQLQSHNTITPSSTITPSPASRKNSNGLADFLMAAPEVQGNRQRTAHACEKCRERKAKCSGERPTCERCTKRGLICQYAAPTGRKGAPILQIDMPANHKRRGSADVLGSPQKSRRNAQSSSRPRHQLERSFSRSQPCSPVREAAVFSWMPADYDPDSPMPQQTGSYYAAMEAQQAWRAAGKHSYLAGTLEGTRGLDNVMHNAAVFQPGYPALPQVAQPLSQGMLDGSMMHDHRVYGLEQPQRDRWSFSDGSDGEWTEFSEPPSATRSEFSLASDMEPHSRPWSTSEAAPMNALTPALEAFQFGDSPSNMASQEGANASDAWYSYPTLAAPQQQYQTELEQDVPLMYPKPSLPIGVSDLVDRAGDQLELSAPEGGYFGSSYMSASSEEGELSGVVV